MSRRRKTLNRDIYPDEIFLDSQNIPGFETNRMEGRIEKPVESSSFFGLGLSFFAIAVIFFARISILQVIKGDYYLERSSNNSLRAVSILPDRGAIYDRNGKKLAWNGIESREYLGLPGLGHLVGYVGYPTKEDLRANSDLAANVFVGKDAVEKKYEFVLSGDIGTQLIETDSQGEIVSESLQVEPKAGDDVF